MDEDFKPKRRVSFSNRDLVREFLPIEESYEHDSINETNVTNKSFLIEPDFKLPTRNVADISKIFQDDSDLKVFDELNTTRFLEGIDSPLSATNIHLNDSPSVEYSPPTNFLPNPISCHQPHSSSIESSKNHSNYSNISTTSSIPTSSPQHQIRPEDKLQSQNVADIPDICQGDSDLKASDDLNTTRFLEGIESFPLNTSSIQKSSKDHFILSTISTTPTQHQIRPDDSLISMQLLNACLEVDNSYHPNHFTNSHLEHTNSQVLKDVSNQLEHTNSHVLKDVSHNLEHTNSYVLKDVSNQFEHTNSHVLKDVTNHLEHTNSHMLKDVSHNLEHTNSHVLKDVSNQFEHTNSHVLKDVTNQLEHTNSHLFKDISYHLVETPDDDVFIESCNYIKDLELMFKNVINEEKCVFEASDEVEIEVGFEEEIDTIEEVVNRRSYYKPGGEVSKKIIQNEDYRSNGYTLYMKNDHANPPKDFIQCSFWKFVKTQLQETKHSYVRKAPHTPPIDPQWLEKLNESDRENISKEVDNEVDDASLTSESGGETNLSKKDILKLVDEAKKMSCNSENYEDE